MLVLPNLCFSKQDIISQLELTPQAARGRIARALNNKTILLLKGGLYIDAAWYVYESDKIKLCEYIASRIHSQSYISLEYMLQKYLMLPSQSLSSITSVTTKQAPHYKNFAGNFVYQNIKPTYYFGFEEVKFRNQTYRVATKAKALFDYLYLRPEFGSRSEKYIHIQLFRKSSLQWENFSEGDFEQFQSYVWKSNSFKMMRLRRVIEGYFEGKKFDAWRKQLLA